MEVKSESLVTQLEAKVQEARATLAALSEADWRTVTEAERWSVGVTAHHFASVLEPISAAIATVVAGQSLPFTNEWVDEMNARHAKDHADCTKAETIQLLERGTAMAVSVIRGLSDEQLAKSGTFVPGAPPMTVEQLILNALHVHIDEHFGSIRKTVAAVATTADADAERAIGVIVLAFSRDPASRWSFPDPDGYLTHFPALVRAFGGRAFAHGTAYHVGDFAGAALWLPPNVHPDDAGLMAVLERGMPAERRADAFALFEQMSRYHPTEPHWYLPMIGVDPVRQGRGHGSALLDHALRHCDRDHTPAYLESTNPANIPLYERHGFEVLATIQAGASPPIFPMRRAAR
jgi:ribosomal protein S18 acetylase RimI-like enzyme